MELVKNLNESLGEIADKRAADTARVHLGDLNACILKETAVDTDLTELIFYKNELFAHVRFLDELLDKSGLTCAKKAGKNIYFRHFYTIALSGRPP